MSYNECRTVKVQDARIKTYLAGCGKIASMPLTVDQRCAALTCKYLPALVFAGEVTGFSATKIRRLRSATVRGLLGTTAP